MLYGLKTDASRDDGDLMIVKLVLENWAEVNTSPGGQYGTALNAASARGNSAIVKLLLEKRGM